MNYGTPHALQVEANGIGGNVFVFPSLFHEAMEMIFDSYAYFEYQDSLDDPAQTQQFQTLMSNEMSRVTMRLTTVMAWLMARKAVLSGQISAEEAAENYRIDGEEYCLESRSDLDHLLPAYMLDLLTRSQQLYERVWRLDQDLSQQASLL